MSGVKDTYVTMTARERDRLLQQAANANSLSVTNATLNRINNDLTNSLNAANRRITTLNSNLTNMNNNLAAVKASADANAEALHQALTNAIKDSNDRLAAQAAQHKQDLDRMEEGFTAALDDTREEIANAMAANNRRIEDVIATNNAALRSEIEAVSDQVVAVAAIVETATADNNTLLEMARQYQAAAEALNNDSRNYRCELLLPGGFKEVEDAETTASNDIATAEKMPGNASVARNNARIAYERAIRFHEEIIRAEQAWTLADQAARQAVAASREQIDASRVVTTSAGGRSVETDVECWSNGGITALTQRADALSGLLDPETNTLDDLQGIQAAAEQLSADTQSTVVFAMESTISSQRRPDSSARLGRMIKERTGLRLVSHSYDGEDQRAAHRTHLKNPITGMELVIIQTPEVQADGSIANHLESHVLDYGTNNQEDAGNAIAAALEILGGNCKERPGYETRTSDLVSLDSLQDLQTRTATTAATAPGAAGGVAKPTAVAAAK